MASGVASIVMPCCASILITDFSCKPTIWAILALVKGVNITINDVLLGNIATDKFFSMLLRTWVGKVPLSSDYKDGILKNGNVSAELKSRFDKIKPSKERSTEVAGWSKIKSAADLAAEKEKEKEREESHPAAVSLRALA